MDDKLVVVYSMRGCPYCTDFKKLLDDANIEYDDRDIHTHKEEFDIFVELTGEEYVPSFMLVDEVNSNEPIPTLYAPEKDFDKLEEGIEIIKKFLKTKRKSPK